ncbi:hypothetical protein ILYODFUR_015577 [Ilyodon furcidens]|uniref:Uncharacterized protein n=1 Tax=Ilyodon furcidens TaxID=33524 RepID=A0ABV0U6S2_9TELE
MWLFKTHKLSTCAEQSAVTPFPGCAEKYAFFGKVLQPGDILQQTHQPLGHDVLRTINPSLNKLHFKSDMKFSGSNQPQMCEVSNGDGPALAWSKAEGF